MKTIILAFLLCVSQIAFGQDIYSALIGHAFTTDSTIALYFNIHTKSNVSSIPKSLIEVTLSDISTNTHISISNYRLISQVKEHIGCDSSYDTWMHQYAASIDLTDAAFSALSTACVLRGELIVSNRLGGSTTTDGTNKPIYVYDQFEKCSKTLSNRNTHRTISNGMFYSCLNQPTSHNLGAFDIAEFDSISFQLVSPMTDRKTSTTFKTGLSALKPIDVNSTSQFSFDPVLGKFKYQPTDAKQNLASVSIKTIEWRKDASGVSHIVGSSMREILIVIDQCQSNNPPVVKGIKSIEVCEGEQICFEVATLDKAKTLPPPMPKPKKDSVTIKWNRGIPGATFTVIDPKEIHQRARFCWTTKIGEASSLPYTFVVTARDDFCPTNGITNAAFSVYVTPKPEGNLRIWKASDTSFSVKVNIPTAHDETNYSVLMQLEDLNGNKITDSIIGYFNWPGKRSSSNRFEDILIMKTSSKFVIHTTIENKYAKNCTADFLDTLNYHTLSTPNILSQSLTLYPNPTNGVIHFDQKLSKVGLRNSVGQLLQHFASAESISLESLPAGVYFVSGLRGNERFVGRVIKD